MVWNQKTICPPPIYTILVNIGDINLSRLETVCSTAVIVLSSQKHLHIEAAALSRVLYRMKSKFHNDKGFKSMEKVNRGLLQYLSMDLLRTYKMFSDSVPKQRKASVYVPTRQMLEWLLVRTQGFAKLFCYIAQACQDAALYLHLRLNTGHVWNMALLCLALVSRIWSIAKYLVNCVCDWYTKLKPFLKELQSNGETWLPTDYVFPVDLVTWLDAAWLTQQALPKIQKPLSILDKVITGINIDDANDIFLEKTEMEANVSDKETIEQEEKELKFTMPVAEDIGETISRRAATRKPVDTRNSNYKKSKKQYIKEIELFSDNKIIPLSVTKKVPNGSKEKYMRPIKNIKPCSITGNVLQIGTENSPNNFDSKFTKSKQKYNESDKESPRLDVILHIATVGDTKSKSHKSKMECIRGIKTCSDLEVFLNRELKLRDKCSKTCVTRGLDKLQCNMFHKAMAVYVKKLKSSDVKKDKELCETMMKKARKAIKLRIL